jgi:hypothetical protein
MLLICASDEQEWWEASPEQRAAVYAEYGALSAELAQRGSLLAGGELDASTTATCVRVRDGRRLLSDGPFAETKEVLGGFFLVEAHDMDEALAIAARIPTARTGSVEVRPVFELHA